MLESESSLLATKYYGSGERNKNVTLIIFVLLIAMVVLLFCVIVFLIAVITYQNINHDTVLPIIKAKKLQKSNSEAYFFSPASSPFGGGRDVSEYKQEIEHIFVTQFGWFKSVHFADHMADQYGGYLAGSDGNRSADIMSGFQNSDVNVMIANRGGYGCNRLLDLLDYDQIRRNPKIIVGYSDLTSLLNVIFLQTGLITFYGPMGVDNWVRDWPLENFNLNAFYTERILFENEMLLLNNPVHNKTITIKGGKSQGVLLGGTLTLMASLVGTRYFPPYSKVNIHWDDVILFMEDIGEQVRSIDRMMSQLKNAGILDRIKGFVWGTCVRCPELPSTFTVLEVLRQYVDHVVSFSGSMIGHHGQQFMLPVGARAEIDADKGTIQLLEHPLLD